MTVPPPPVAEASSPTRPGVVVHPYQGSVRLVASPPVGDRDAAGWWAAVQALALAPTAPGFEHEQVWILKAQAHWPGLAHDDGYVGAWERDRLCAELMSAELVLLPPQDVPAPALQTAHRGPNEAFRLRPAMQDALVRGLLTDGVIGSSDLCQALVDAPNVDLVRRLLTDDGIRLVREPHGCLERAPAGEDRIARHEGSWRTAWPGALNEVAEQHQWSSVGAMVDLLVELGWPVDVPVRDHTPLVAAVRHANAGAVDALLRHGACPTYRPVCTHDGKTWLGTSAWDQALDPLGEEMLPRLLAAGVVPDQASLHRAVHTGADGALDHLLALGLDPFPADETLRPGRLPRLLRRARARRWVMGRYGIPDGEDGFAANHRRLEQIWLRRQIPDDAVAGRGRRRL